MNLGKRLTGSVYKWLLLVLAIAVIPIAVIATNPIHNFEGKCKMCHLSIEKGKQVFVKDIDSLCNNCHHLSGFSHPSGFKPSIEVPVKFPLDWAGRITCTTCHETHGKGDYLIRGGKTGKVLCYSCHKESFVPHGGLTQSAHTRQKSVKRWYEVVNIQSPIDKLSQECLGCHDSTFANSASIGLGILNHGDGMSHPIGVDYMEAYAKGGLNPPSSMPSSITLYNGKIGCGSCHNLYSKEKHYLVINNRRSTLCLTCHQK